MVDEGGWARFLKEALLASTILAPAGHSQSMVKIVSAEKVAEVIVTTALLHGADSMPTEIYSQTISAQKFLDAPVIETSSTNSYFNNWMLNLSMSIFCSFLIPFIFKSLVQEKLASKSMNPESIKNRELKISGMTRLYLYGEQTRSEQRP